MNAIPSALFRKTYAKLTEPTVVTVNGHAIGTWTPATGGEFSAWVKAEGSTGTMRVPERLDPTIIPITATEWRGGPSGHQFGSSRAAPKPRHK